MAGSPSTQLMDLPNEVLMTVMSHLDLPSLANATLVSQHFDNLAEPYLYQSLEILRGDNARALVKSLLRKRQRAIWVNTLLVSTKHGNDDGLELLPPHIRRMRNLRTLVLETPDCNALTSEKRVSWIDLQNRYERIFEAASLLAPNTTERPLSHLQKCTLHFVDDRTSLYSLTKYASIFLHPTLKSLTISCMSTDYPNKLPIDLNNNPQLIKSTALEDLHLEECDILPETLAILLSLPRALKSLKISEGVRYDHLYRNSVSRMHGNLQPNRFMPVLALTCAETLESLSLSLGYRHRSGQQSHSTKQYLNMTSLEKVTYLEVNKKTLDLLVSAQECDHNTNARFPPNLETLKVFGISLGPRLPFEPRCKALVPVPFCVIQERAKHGVCQLRELIYSYEYYEDEDDEDEDITAVLDDNHNDFMAVVHNLLVDPQGVTYGPTAPMHDDTTDLQAPDGTEPWRPTLNATTLDWQIATNNRAPVDLPGPALDRGMASMYEFTRIERCKISLLNVLNGEVLPQLKQTDVLLRADLVSLPHGYIPPYLHPEDKPVTTAGWWCSDNARETSRYKMEMRLARIPKQYERVNGSSTQRQRRSLRQRLGHLGMAALDWHVRNTPGA